MSRSGQVVVAGVTAAAVLAMAGPSRAQPAPPPAAPAAPPTAPTAPTETPADDSSPWARGVSAERRAEASRLLAEGNDLFVRLRHREALARYQEAAAAWDHPAIRYNIARALIALDRPVEAYQEIEKALAHGAAPLKEQVFTEAQIYQRLLRRQIAEMEVRCTQPGVEVRVDGQRFLTCPGSRSVLLAPGSHQLVARRPGYLTLSREVIVMPGPKAAVDVALVSIADATTTERRWASWKPWAVVGGGAVVAVSGVLLQRKAASDMDQYERDFAVLCPDGACAPGDLPDSIRELRSRARLESGIAITGMVAGAAVAAGGAVLVLLNRPRLVSPEQPPLAPMVTPTSVGASLQLRF